MGNQVPVRPRRELRHVAIATFASVACACSVTQQPQPAHPDSVEVLFPWPAQLAAASEGQCSKIESNVRAGLAYEGEVWLAVTCVVDRLVTTGRAQEVDGFLTAVRRFESGTQSFITVTPEQARAAGFVLADPPPKEVTLYVSNEQRAKHDSLKSIQAPTLGSGSFRGLCLPWRRKQGVGGHYEVTEQAIHRVRAAGIPVTPAAAAVLADASQDVDSFEWNQMAAHGQTADAGGLPSESEEAAKQHWHDWIKGRIAEAGKRCAADQDDVRLQGVYLLGYAIHAVEDVASHRGRTNPEHAYNALLEANPDNEQGIDKLATELAGDVLIGALRGKASACLPILGTLSKGFLLFPEKMSAFQFGWQGNPVELVKYEVSVADFMPHKDKPQARTRWFGPVGSWAPNSTCKLNPGCMAVEAIALDAVH